MTNGFPLLSLTILLPLAGCGLILAAGAQRARVIALTTTLAAFVLTLVPLACFRPETAGFQFVEHRIWIEALGISYHVGIDGLSLFLLPLTGFLSAAAVLVSWNAAGEKTKAYFISFLVLETGMLGVFVALDAILFYVFWEAMLIPMFLIIGIWGGGNRRYAAIKFIIYTVAGSLFLLAGFIITAFLAKPPEGKLSFDLLQWLSTGVPSAYQKGLFAAYFVAFAVKIPLFPLHTWLPDAHVEAPTAGSVLLAGVLLKMGVYGILRFCFPLFPEGTAFFTPFVMALGVTGIVYGALVAFAQTDMKRLVAYSSVSHMGLIVVGIFCLNLAGIKGGVVQMLNHGLSTGALFILVGAIYERKKTRNLDMLGGLAGKMPVLASFFMITMLSSIGLPGLNGFVGEFLLLLGSYRYAWWLGALAATSLVLGAAYLLWMTQRVFFEQDRSPETTGLSDVSLREKMIMVPIIVLMLWIGLYPAPLSDRLEPMAHTLIAVSSKRPPLPATAETRTITEEATHALARR